jgi:O-antigen/teichoic acid export membrane protein
LHGIYSLALIVSGFLTIFTDYGVSQALTRFIALYRSRGEQGRIIPLLRAGLSFSLTTSLTMLLIGFIFADKLTSLLISRSEMVQLVRITLVLVLIQPLTAAAGCTLLGFRDMKDYAIIDVIRQLVRTVVSPS